MDAALMEAFIAFPLTLKGIFDFLYVPIGNFICGDIDALLQLGPFGARITSRSFNMYLCT